MAKKDYNERYETERWRPQDDIPYEQIVKHIIEDYYRLEEQLEKVAAYARKLEREVENEKKERAKKAATNSRMQEKLTEARRKITRLEGYIHWLRETYNIPDRTELTAMDFDVPITETEDE